MNTINLLLNLFTQLWLQQRRLILILALAWTGFVITDVSKNLFFAQQLSSWLAWIQNLLYSSYQIAPWLFFSIVIGMLVLRLQTQSIGRNLRVLLHFVVASFIALIHISLLTSSFWLFLPHVVKDVSISFVYVEQLLKWLPFEYLAYTACVLLWQKYLSNNSVPDSGEEFFFVSDCGQVAVRPSEISWMRADDNYVVLHREMDELRVRSTLKTLLEKLPEQGFFQTHRSAVVNLNHIAKVGNLRITLNDGTKVPISRRRHSALLAVLPS